MHKILAFLKSPGPAHLSKGVWLLIIGGGVAAGFVLLRLSSGSAATGGSSTDTVSPTNPGDTGAGDAGGTGTGNPVTPNGGGGGSAGGGTDGGVSGYYDGSGYTYDTGTGSYDTSGSAGIGKQPLGLPPALTYAGPPQLQGTQIVTYAGPPSQNVQALSQAYQAPNSSTVTYNTVQKSSPNLTPIVTYSPPSPPAPSSVGTVAGGFAV